VTNVLVRNNTLVNNARFFNNIVVTAAEGDGARKALRVGNSKHTIALDYNLYFVPGGAQPLFVWPGEQEYAGLTAFRAASGNEARGLTGALFRSAAEADWRLSAGSPAINAGAAHVAAPTDFAGAQRPREVRPDLGAFEVNESPPAWSLSPGRARPAVPPSAPPARAARQSTGRS
jgi:hypothetical protein